MTIELPEAIEHDVGQGALRDPEFRRPFFGASHTAVLFNDHPFQTAAEYWLDKRDGTSQPETQAMVRGRMLEDAIANWWANEQYPEPSLQLCNPVTRGHLICIPDREITPGYDILSIKTTTKRDELPSKYWIWQAHAEMLITGARNVQIVWLDGRMELGSDTLSYDADIGMEIWTRSAEFMASIDTGVMPDWVAASRSPADIARQYDELDNDTLEADRDLEALLGDYATMKAEADKYIEAVDELRRQILRIVEAHGKVMAHGEVIATVPRINGRKGIDTKALAAAHPDIAAEFTIEGAPHRQIRLSKQFKKEHS